MTQSLDNKQFCMWLQTECLHVSLHLIDSQRFRYLISLRSETEETKKTPKVQREQLPGTFEQDLQLHLKDISVLFGDSGCTGEMRAALPLRATVVVSLVQSLTEWAAPLRISACSAAGEQLKTRSSREGEKEPNIPLIGQARRVECLFVACLNEGDADRVSSALSHPASTSLLHLYYVGYACS